MPPAITAHSFAATSISVLFWWTVASPLLAVVTALLAGARPRLRLALVIVIVIGPILLLAPLAAMRGGLGALVASAAVAAEVTAVVIAAGALERSRRGGVPAWAVTVALVCAVAGGMLGALAVLATLAVI